MSRPFQCLSYILQEDLGRDDILVAASGSHIYFFDIASGNPVSVWSSEQDHEVPLNNAADTITQKSNEISPHEAAYIDVARPSKRQKVLPPLGEFAGSSADPLKDDRILKVALSEVPRSSTAVIKLLGTHDGRYVIAVTDDKCIRVVELSADNISRQLSARQMPKRPCAIVLTPDQETILCADKFGDVYSLPLLEPSNEGSTVANDGVGKGSVEKDEADKKPFVPAANVKTVHTLRNRVALQHQQAINKSVAKTKSSNLEHRLLLGHVSMLTDLLCLSVSDSISNAPQEKTYILTSDRDEHIRISRGMPQAHIIEGYCLGHEEFVSKLCIPRWHKQLLISGGGDEYLLTWNWFSGEILQKVDLRCHVDDFKRQSISAIDSVGTRTLAPDMSKNGENLIAISGIWAVEGLDAKPGNLYGEVVVACEGVPALFMYHLSSDLKLDFREYIALPGNILDIATVNSRCMIIYSLDSFHVPFSTTVLADEDKQSSTPRLGSLILDGSGLWKQRDILQDAVANIDMEARGKDVGVEQGGDGGKSLSSLFYGIGNLRKRGLEDFE